MTHRHATQLLSVSLVCWLGGIVARGEIPATPKPLAPSFQRAIGPSPEGWLILQVKRRVCLYKEGLVLLPGKTATVALSGEGFGRIATASSVAGGYAEARQNGGDQNGRVRVSVTLYDHGQPVSAPPVDYGNPDAMTLVDEATGYLAVTIQFAKKESEGRLPKEILANDSDQQAVTIRRYEKAFAGYEIVDERGKPTGELVGFYVDLRQGGALIDQNGKTISSSADFFARENARQTSTLNSSGMGTSVELVFAGQWGDLVNLSLRASDGSQEPLIGDFLPPEYRFLGLTKQQIIKMRQLARRRADWFRRTLRKAEFARSHQEEVKELQDQFAERLERQTAAFDAMLTDDQRIKVEEIRKQLPRRRESDKAAPLPTSP